MSGEGLQDGTAREAAMQRWNEWIDGAGETVAVLTDEELDRLADRLGLRLVGRRDDGTLVWQSSERRASRRQAAPGGSAQDGTWRGEESPPRIIRRAGVRRRLVAANGHRRRAGRVRSLA